MATAIHVPLSDLVEDLEEIVTRIIWSTVTTTDTHGRPRTRVMHPTWNITPQRWSAWSAPAPRR